MKLMFHFFLCTTPRLKEIRLNNTKVLEFQNPEPV